MVAGADAGDALSDALDDAGAFVAEEVGKEFVRSLGRFDLVDLRAADAAVVEADMDLAEGEGVGHLEFGDFKWGVGFDEDGGFHSGK